MYNRLIKLVKISVILIFLAVLLSPFIALLLPKKLRKHTYAELVYQFIADNQTKDCKTQYEKIAKISQYVRANIVFGGDVYDGKPLDYLIKGAGYCDYQARALDALLGKIGIPARYAMMVDKDGISPHTVNEVFIDGKWAVLDVTYNMTFKNGDVYLDAADLKANPSLIDSVFNSASIEQGRSMALKQDYLRTLPFESQWRRSTPRVKQYHIVDYLISLYYKIFGRAFADFYQDCYLKISLKELKDPAQSFFLRARNYDLLNRKFLADKYYSQLISDFPDSEYAKQSIKFRQALITHN